MANLLEFASLSLFTTHRLSARAYIEVGDMRPPCAACIRRKEPQRSRFFL